MSELQYECDCLTWAEVDLVRHTQGNGHNTNCEKFELTLKPAASVRWIRPWYCGQATLSVDGRIFELMEFCLSSQAGAYRYLALLRGVQVCAADSILSLQRRVMEYHAKTKGATRQEK